MGRHERRERKALDFLMQERPEGYETIVDYTDPRNWNATQQGVMNALNNENRTNAIAALKNLLVAKQIAKEGIDFDFLQALESLRDANKSIRTPRQERAFNSRMDEVETSLRQVPGLSEEQIQTLKPFGVFEDFQPTNAPNGDVILGRKKITGDGLDYKIECEC